MNDDFVYRALPKVSQVFSQSLYSRISVNSAAVPPSRGRIVRGRLKPWQAALIIFSLVLLVAWAQVVVRFRYVPIGNLWLVELGRTTQSAPGVDLATIFVPTPLPTPEIWDGTSIPDDIGRFVLYFPSWIPHGFLPIEVPQENTPYESTLAIWVNDSDEKIRLFMAPLAGGMHPYAPTGMYEEIRVNGRSAILIHGRLALKKPGESSRKWDGTLGLQIHWILDKYVYAIETFGSYVSESDLIRMAESMKDIPPPSWTPNTP